MDHAFDRHPSPEVLASFDSGELPASLWQAVEDHVAGCETCCRQLESLPADPLSSRMRTAGCDGPTISDTSAMPAELLDHPRYRLVKLLGVGGMGAVYLAEHRLMHRFVALKTMRKSLLDRPAAVNQFRLEARAAARLSHPNIVAAFDADQAGDTHFLVLEFVPGERLDRIVERQGPMPILEACDIIRQAALGLEHARESGMVHRDIKPQNLLRSPDGTVKILDFGLATFAREARRSPEPLAIGAAGPITGTPDFVAPEQAIDPGRVDIRTDIYGLGGTFRFLLTGKPPFPEKATAEKIDGHLRRSPEPIESLRPDVPPEVRRIVGRMMARDPDRRYATPAEVVADLTAVLAPSASRSPLSRRLPRPNKAAGWIMAAACAISLAVVAILFWMRPVAPPIATDSADLQAASKQPERNSTPEKGRKAEAPVLHLPRINPNIDPPTADPPPIEQYRSEIKARIREWVSRNNAFGPEHSIVDNLAANVDKELVGGDAFELHLGSGLLTSGQATVLAALHGEFFVLPMTLDQEKARKLPPNTAVTIRTKPFRGPIDAPPLAELHDLQIDDADALDPSGPVTGSVRIRRLREGGRNFALRMISVPAAKISVTGTHYLDALPDVDGTVRFGFTVFDDRPEREGAFVVFLELIRMTMPDRPDTSVLSSRPIARIVTVAKR
jgi:serine/threonine protein kinase